MEKHSNQSTPILGDPRYIEPVLKENKEFVMLAVSKCWREIQWASPELREDDDVFWTCVHNMHDINPWSTPVIETGPSILAKTIDTPFSKGRESVLREFLSSV